MRQLSKSKIISYRQCPKRLWLELHRPELRDDSGKEAVFAIGNQVGEVAQQIYDSESRGLIIDVDAIGWEEAYKQTAEWLREAKGPIFEAALRIPGALALADVMLPERATDGSVVWRMIEVKSTASVKDYQRDDLAIQSYIARTSGVSLSGAAVAHIDTSFVYPGSGDYLGLLKEVDLTEEALGRHDEVGQWLAEAQEVAGLAEEPEIAVGPHCSDPFECSFCAYCKGEEPDIEYPLSSFYRISAARREQLRGLGFEDVREVPDVHLSGTNRWIKQQTESGETYFDREGAKADLAQFSGEPRFLDFETIAFAVPIWAGTSPYAQIPFQYSLHHMTANGEVHHHEFLDLSGEDPSEVMAEALIRDCAEAGPIFAYNASFEMRVVRQLAERFPAHAEALKAINRRVVDLLPIARKRFYAPSQHGSWSLKALLPAICPELKYSELEGVQDGGLAQQAYLEAIGKETPAERREEVRRQLLEYCKLDTFALVKVWESFAGSGGPMLR